MGRSHTVFSLGYIILWFVGILRTTGGSVTWYEPLPVETIPVHSTDHTANKVQALEGFPKVLSWNFSFTSDLSFSSLTINLDSSTVVGGVLSSGLAGIQSGFTDRFNFSWIPIQKFSLIIFNVTADDNATFTCALTLIEGFGTNPWKSNIQVDVVDPPVITYISPNQTVNESDVVTLICTTVGKPKPDTTWTRLSDNKVVTFPLNITGKQDEGFYRCTTKNVAGNDTADVFITVQNYNPENTNLTTNLSDNIADVNTNFNLICSAQANPPAKYRIYKEQESLFNTTTSSNVPVVYTTSVTERINQVKFSCTPFNDFGDGPTVKITVTVHYPPEIITEPASQSVIEGNGATLFCNATGNPPPSITWTKQGSNSVLSTSDTLTLTNLRRGDNGTVYKCEVQNNLGSDESTAMITVLYPPEIITAPASQSVIEGNGTTLFCNATGDPQPNITWTKQGNNSVLSTSDTLTLTNLRRGDNGAVYKCEVHNKLGSDESTATITVLYPPKITRPKAGTNTTERGTIIKCDAEGNPSPTYVWRNETGGVVANEKTFTLTYDGNYTCIASNKLGSDTRSIVIEIPSYYYQGEMSVKKRNGVTVDFKPEYKDLNSPPAKELIKEFKNEMDKLHKNDSTYNRTEVTGLSNGSVIVSFVLYFTTPVTASEGLAKLKAAADNGTLGAFTVGALKIIPNVNPTSTPPVSPTGSTTAVSPHVTTGPTPIKNGVLPLWIIILAVVGGVVVMVVIIAVVAWCVHNKRKCRRKGARVSNSESDVALEGQVNGGYADSGPPSANGANRTDVSVLLHEQPTAAAPPTYAVVDKKKKKEKKADKKEDHNVAKQDVPDYAVVDKSQKKKKKEEVEDAYAQVDMSKKSKKKPKPGEMLYADLGEFQQRDMPAVSTSPAPLPPIKRPPAYEETQYADITQFLTGNATLPDTNNSQGTEMTSANADGGNEKPKETANKGGNEEKPKKTANEGGNEEKPKETRM